MATIRCWAIFLVESSTTVGERYHSKSSVTLLLGVGTWLLGQPLRGAGEGVVGRGGGAQSSLWCPSPKPKVKLLLYMPSATIAYSTCVCPFNLVWRRSTHLFAG